MYCKGLGTIYCSTARIVPDVYSNTPFSKVYHSPSLCVGGSCGFCRLFVELFVFLAIFYWKDSRAKRWLKV